MKLNSNELPERFEEIEMSIRLSNILRSHNILTVAEALNTPESTYYSWKRMGKKSMLELENILKNYTNFPNSVFSPSWAPPQWISVKDRVPPTPKETGYGDSYHSDLLLIFTDAFSSEGEAFIGYYCKYLYEEKGREEWGYVWNIDQVVDDHFSVEVTHWMPLPKSP